MDGSVVVTGCAGPAGQAAVQALLAQGQRVFGADASAEALARLSADLPAEQRARFGGEVVDLLDPVATEQWAARVLAAGPVAGVVHLVGGWRGGKSFGDNDLVDSQWLFDLLVRTLQHVSLAFHDALVATDGRFAIVSATAVANPTPGSASYAAAKSAAATWTAALAASFAQAGAGAAVVFVVKALVAAPQRVGRPEADFAGYTDVTELAQQVTQLWGRPSADLNGQVLDLS